MRMRTERTNEDRAVLSVVSHEDPVRVRDRERTAGREMDVLPDRSAGKPECACAAQPDYDAR